MDDILPSIFDRLIDPTLAPGRGFNLSRAQACLTRDLEDLLNTRRPADGFFAGLIAVEASIANFGLRDHTHVNANSSEDRHAYADHIRQVIERFEPRLSQVRVEARLPDEARAEQGNSYRIGAIYFRIRATLNLDPAPVEGVVFDSLFEVTTGRHQVGSEALR